MARLIVDGYNVIRRIDRFLSAEEKGLEEGRFALLLALEEYGAKTGFDITVVFDGGARPPDHDSPGGTDRFAGVDVIFSERGKTADFEIERLLRRHARQRLEDPCDVILVTDDMGIRDCAIGSGAFVASPGELDRAMEAGVKLAY
ncbi:MAG: NYN domain-containing protein [Proteobacteria bacterium]|nr:NYN domain-containing protein [Pseudomonadota bacterium]